MAWVGAPGHYVVPVNKADQCGVPGTNSANPPLISIGPARLRGASRPKRNALFAGATRRQRCSGSRGRAGA